MNLIKQIFKIVFLIQIVLFVVAAICRLFSTSLFDYIDYLAVALMIFVQAPMFLIFIIVLFYHYFIKKTTLYLFKRELIYICVFVASLLLLSFSYYIFP